MTRSPRVADIRRAMRPADKPAASSPDVIPLDPLARIAVEEASKVFAQRQAEFVQQEANYRAKLGEIAAAAAAAASVDWPTSYHLSVERMAFIKGVLPAGAS